MIRREYPFGDAMIEQGQYALGEPLLISQKNIDEVLGGTLHELE